MSLRVYVICCVIYSALIAGCATTPTVDSGTVAVETRDARAVIVFSDSDRARIRHFYRSGKKVKAMPPGLAKKEKLPPGLQKHVIKYGKLPPGLAARRLPDELDRTLSYLPSGYVRVRVGGDVYLMHEKTRVVFDVVWNVFTGR
jgi:hypothetical protein